MAGESMFALHHETDDAYHVQHPDGRVLPVPKKGTPASVLAAARALPKVEPVESEEPEKLADGGDVVSGRLDGQGLEANPGEQFKGSMWDDPVAVSQAQGLAARTPTEVARGATAAPTVEYDPTQGAPPPAEAASYPGDELRRPPDAATAPQPGAVAAQASGASMPAMPSLPGYNAGPAMAKVKEAQRLTSEGADLQAQAQAQYSTEATQIRDQQANDLAKLEADRQAKYAQVYQERDALFDDLKNSRIDPTRFWSSRSSSQKTSALVGMVLGGIGSGLTGQPNAALQVIQSAIDRDIDAQRATMGQKNNNLRFLSEKLGDVNSAAAYQRMAMLTDVGNRLEAAAARSGNQQAMATAKLLKAQSAQIGVTPLLHMADAQYQSDLARTQMGWQQRMFQYGMQMANGQGGQGNGYLPSRAPPPQGTDPMSPMKFAVEARRDAAERTVPGPGGQPFLAYDKGVAEKVRPALAAASTAQKLLGDLQSLRQNASGIPGTDAADQYEKTRRLFAEQWAMTLGQSSLSDTQFKNLEAVLPSRWDAFVRGKSRFTPIAKALHDRTSALYDQAGLHPSAIPVYQEPTR